MEHPLKVILIGGASNAGKSTLAQALAARLGWACTSTDSLARHPGRPWPVPDRAVPPHVTEHYLSLTLDELIASVLAHYRNLRPLIETLVRKHADDPAATPLILEGSALLPETVTGLLGAGAAFAWLTADEPLFRSRIRAESRYDEADTAGKAMIDKFIARTLAFDRLIDEDVVRLALPRIVVDERTTVESLIEACLTRIRRP